MCDCWQSLGIQKFYGMDDASPVPKLPDEDGSNWGRRHTCFFPTNHHDENQDSDSDDPPTSSKRVKHPEHPKDMPLQQTTPSAISRVVNNGSQSTVRLRCLNCARFSPRLAVQALCQHCKDVCSSPSRCQTLYPKKKHDFELRNTCLQPDAGARCFLPSLGIHPAKVVVLANLHYPPFPDDDRLNVVSCAFPNCIVKSDSALMASEMCSTLLWVQRCLSVCITLPSCYSAYGFPNPGPPQLAVAAVVGQSLAQCYHGTVFVVK